MITLRSTRKNSDFLTCLKPADVHGEGDIPKGNIDWLRIYMHRPVSGILHLHFVHLRESSQADNKSGHMEKSSDTCTPNENKRKFVVRKVKKKHAQFYSKHDKNVKY